VKNQRGLTGQIWRSIETGEWAKNCLQWTNRYKDLHKKSEDPCRANLKAIRGEFEPRNAY